MVISTASEDTKASDWLASKFRWRGEVDGDDAGEVEYRYDDISFGAEVVGRYDDAPEKRRGDVGVCVVEVPSSTYDSVKRRQ